MLDGLFHVYIPLYLYNSKKDHNFLYSIIYNLGLIKAPLEFNKENDIAQRIVDNSGIEIAHSGLNLNTFASYKEQFPGTLGKIFFLL